MRIKYEWQGIGFGKTKLIETGIKEPRPEGFYPVKYQGQWTLAEWCKDGWVFIGDISFRGDEHFDMIHEEKIELPNY